MNDPWKHRSANMRCLSCMWYVRKDSTDGGASLIGRCRRHAPTMSGYPVVFGLDWCGDHKLSEDYASGMSPMEAPSVSEIMRERMAIKCVKEDNL